jgi:2-keto-4-pentenoate hydratase/2-oxohepta-3-ene-1,7-dioic acid hydratase in catechol pathway
MKLVRYGNAGAERPGLIGADGNLRDLSSIIDDIHGDTLRHEVITRIAQECWSDLPRVSRPTRLGAPVIGIGKFIAVGLNYRDHAKEANMAIPAEPVIFTKATSCVIGPNDEVMLPRHSRKTDWEVELGVVLGRTASYVTEDHALDYVAGYCVVNDLSEREYQLERGGTWDKGKGCDTFGPIGPYLVTADEVGDPQNLDLWLDVNGERMQTGNTKTMIFPIRALLSYISEFMTLYPGDIITTGTPPGVGLGRKPSPVFLKEGDVIELGIAGLGQQRQSVVSWSRTHANDP